MPPLDSVICFASLDQSPPMLENSPKRKFEARCCCRDRAKTCPPVRHTPSAHGQHQVLGADVLRFGRGPPYPSCSRKTLVQRSSGRSVCLLVRAFSDLSISQRVVLKTCFEWCVHGTFAPDPNNPREFAVLALSQAFMIANSTLLLRFLLCSALLLGFLCVQGQEGTHKAKVYMHFQIEAPMKF